MLGRFSGESLKMFMWDWVNRRTFVFNSLLPMKTPIFNKSLHEECGVGTRQSEAWFLLSNYVIFYRRI